MQTGDNGLQLLGVLPQLAFLLPAHPREFLTGQVIFLLTLHETGVEAIDTTPIIPDE